MKLIIPYWINTKHLMIWQGFKHMFTNSLSRFMVCYVRTLGNSPQLRHGPCCHSDADTPTDAQPPLLGRRQHLLVRGATTACHVAQPPRPDTSPNIVHVHAHVMKHTHRPDTTILTLARWLGYKPSTQKIDNSAYQLMLK